MRQLPGILRPSTKCPQVPGILYEIVRKFRKTASRSPYGKVRSFPRKCPDLVPFGSLDTRSSRYVPVRRFFLPCPHPARGLSRPFYRFVHEKPRRGPENRAFCGLQRKKQSVVNQLTKGLSGSATWRISVREVLPPEGPGAGGLRPASCPHSRGAKEEGALARHR